MAQPALPRQVSELEQQLGVRLVHRSTQAVKLTAEGRERILQLLDATRDVSMRHKRADDAYE